MESRIDIPLVIEDIRLSILDLSTPEKIERSAYFFKTRQKVYGATNPEMRMIIREIRRAYLSWTPQQWIALSKALVLTDIYECQFVAYELIAGSKKNLASLSHTDAKAMMCNLDNWASVDQFSVSIFGVLWGRGEVSDWDIDALLGSGDVWMRRVGVVSSVALNTRSRGGTGDVVRTLHVCERLVEERHPMIWKAVSWALRSLVYWDRESVYDFLEKFDDRISPQVRREVLHKLEYGTKN